MLGCVDDVPLTDTAMLPCYAVLHRFIHLSYSVTGVRPILLPLFWTAGQVQKVCLCQTSSQRILES